MSPPITYQARATRIELLQADQFRNAYDWTHDVQGNVSPVLHARFLGEHEFDGYVKPFEWGNIAQCTTTLNEVTGWLLAQASGLPCAPRAFFIQLPLAQLPPYTGPAPLPKPDANGNVLCFGTEAVANTAVRALHTTQMLATEQSQWPFNDQTIAFDEGAGNSDRHIFNLVRRAARDYVLIDHGYLLRTLGAAYPSHWGNSTLEGMVGSTFDNHLHYNTYPLMGRNSPTVCQEGCTKGLHFADTLNKALRHSLFEVSFWCSKLMPGTSERWLQFLNARMKREQMAELLHRRFGTIALHARTTP